MSFMLGLPRGFKHSEPPGVPLNAKSYQFGCGCADRAALPVGASLFGNELPPAPESPPRRSAGHIAPRSARTYRAKSTNSSRSGKDDRLIMRQALAAML